jgi:hypothetical protein
LIPHPEAGYYSSMKSVTDKAKGQERKEFLKLSPLERMEAMHNLILQFLSLKARAEKVSEYEIYTRYLKNNPRHYERNSRSPEEEGREVSEEYL